jgi:hypothetical protein
MAALLDSVDRFLAGRVRLALGRHPIYPDWIAEISEPMFRQLLHEGLFRTVVFWCATALLLFLELYWLPPAHDRPTIWPHRALQTGLFLVIYFIAVRNLRASVTQCVERECVYRRLHGKWRWER